jgi:MFS family permease
MNEPSSRAADRRNFACFLSDAVGWPLGQSFLSPETILPMFVARLSGLHVLIGLLVGIQSFGHLVPQLFAANLIERLPIKKRYVVKLGILGERLPLLIIALAVFAGPSPLLLLVIFYLAWAVSNVATGFNMPAFLTLYAKSVSPGMRGRITGLGNSVGMLFAVSGAFVARTLLERLSGLEAYGWVFLIGVAILLASVVPLGLVNEPEERSPAVGRRLRDYLRQLPRILRGNDNFRTYVLMQVALQMGFVSISFITGYAVLRLGASEGTVALYTATFMAGNALGSLALGFLADARGYRVVYLAGAVCGLLGYGVMVTSPGSLVLFAVFALVGVFRGALAVGDNMAMEFARPEQAATYTAMMFTATSPFRVVLPLAAGAVADAIGTVSVFAVAAAAIVAALALGGLRLKDPRFHPPHPVSD